MTRTSLQPSNQQAALSTSGVLHEAGKVRPPSLRAETHPAPLQRTCLSDKITVAGAREEEAVNTARGGGFLPLSSVGPRDGSWVCRWRVERSTHIALNVTTGRSRETGSHGRGGGNPHEGSLPKLISGCAGDFRWDQVTSEYR
jgi:hypothetical protein